MISELPSPGSIWRHRKTGKQMRVVIVDENRVIGHDCELTGPPAKGLMQSWSSTPSVFADNYIPGDPDQYPSTAHC
jgi:hypothetical protein